MSHVREILAKKGSHIWTVGQEATVLQAALLMNEHRIGALVVMQNEHMVGIITERDMLHRVLAEQRDPTQTLVSQVMTTELACATPETTIEEARTAIKERRIRHLPVVDGGGHLLGLISIGDLNAHHTASQEQTIFLLNEYLYGRV